MLRLNEEIEPGNRPIRRVVGEDDRLAWAGRHAGIDDIGEQPLGRDHEGAARPDDLHAFRDGFGPVGDDGRGTQRVGTGGCGIGYAGQESRPAVRIRTVRIRRERQVARTRAAGDPHIA